MKRLTLPRVGLVLKARNGETLVESVVSLLVLSLLFLAITTMIMTAVKFTGVHNREATSRQAIDNMAVLVKSGSDQTISFNGTLGTTIDVDVSITVTDDPVSFAPKE